LLPAQQTSPWGIDTGWTMTLTDSTIPAGTGGAYIKPATGTASPT